MKRNMSQRVIAVACFLALVSLTAVLRSQSQSTAPVQYDVINLGTFGGSISFAESVNNRGWVAGWSTLLGDQSLHAFLSIDGHVTDLGTLGGPSSSVGSPVHNENGELVGLANTSDIDPFDENFCQFGNSAIGNSYLCQGFIWRNGVMTALSTLGGNNSYGTGLNSRGLQSKRVRACSRGSRIREANPKIGRERASPCPPLPR